MSTYPRYSWPNEYDPKRPDETDVFGADFAKRLEPGETISEASIVCCRKDDTTETAVAGMVVGDVTTAGSTVSSRIAGGDDGVTYSLIFEVRTSAGRTLQSVRDLPVARRWGDV